VDHPLSWDVFVTPGIPVASTDLPPGMKSRLSSPTSSTLIYGSRDAVLVDVFTTFEQTAPLVAWVAAKGRNLTAIYITHGHGDHFFGLAAVLDRFPDARVVATAAVVEQMRRQLTPKWMDFWKARFPSQLPDRFVLAQPLTEPVIRLEGHDLVAVPLGHTDTDDTTCLHAPAVGLVVAGDAAYNDVHLYLSESNAATRREWMAAIDTMEALHPRAVIAGHKRPGLADDPRILGQTRQYIRDFDEAAETAHTAREIYDRVLALHPGRVNSPVLWSSARAVKP
jgi:glyoxylase-like metal-dependent hydrolase (beta-lactamase superfamily II)